MIIKHKAFDPTVPPPGFGNLPPPPFSTKPGIGNPSSAPVFGSVTKNESVPEQTKPSIFGGFGSQSVSGSNPFGQSTNVTSAGFGSMKEPNTETIVGKSGLFGNKVLDTSTNLGLSKSSFGSLKEPETEAAKSGLFGSKMLNSSNTKPTSSNPFGSSSSGLFSGAFGGSTFAPKRKSIDEDEGVELSSETTSQDAAEPKQDSNPFASVTSASSIFGKASSQAATINPAKKITFNANPFQNKSSSMSSGSSADFKVPPPRNTSSTLIIRNLTDDIRTAEFLHDRLAKFGEIVSVKLVTKQQAAKILLGSDTVAQAIKSNATQIFEDYPNVTVKFGSEKKSRDASPEKSRKTGLSKRPAPGKYRYFF